MIDESDFNFDIPAWDENGNPIDEDKSKKHHFYDDDDSEPAELKPAVITPK